ncbi:hypothetical protein MHYP_G00302620 [Metynnis hypsauchen]
MTTTGPWYGWTTTKLTGRLAMQTWLCSHTKWTGSKASSRCPPPTSVGSSAPLSSSSRESSSTSSTVNSRLHGITPGCRARSALALYGLPSPTRPRITYRWRSGSLCVRPCAMTFLLPIAFTPRYPRSGTCSASEPSA